MGKRNNKFNQFVNELVIRSCRLVSRTIRMSENRYGAIGSRGRLQYGNPQDQTRVDLTLNWGGAVYNLEFICGPSESKTISHPEELIRAFESQDVEFVIRRKNYAKTQTSQTYESVLSTFS